MVHQKDPLITSLNSTFINYCTSYTLIYPIQPKLYTTAITLLTAATVIGTGNANERNLRRGLELFGDSGLELFGDSGLIGKTLRRD